MLRQIKKIAVLVLFSLSICSWSNLLASGPREELDKLSDYTQSFLKDKGCSDQLFEDTLNQNKQLILDLLSFITKNVKRSQATDDFIDRIHITFNKYNTILEANKELQQREKVLFDDVINFSHYVLKLYQEDEQDLEASYFTPQEPEKLSFAQQMIPVKERITKRYIGKIPSLVEDVIFYFSNYEACSKNNISIHNRILLHGKPGTGKSYLVKVLAQELELPLLAFTASFFEDKYFGESSRRIRRAFKAAKEYNKPLLVFIDEIDALATKRKDGANNEHRSTLLTLLTELQDIQDNKNIFVFVATNDFKSLDPAIQDRFAGSICEIKDPSVQERAQLFIKVFADKGVTIDAALAQRLAEVVRSSLLADPKDYKHRFSNRDIESIVTIALLKRFADSSNSKEQKHLCAYVRSAMDATSKKGRFAWISPTYCNGI